MADASGEGSREGSAPELSCSGNGSAGTPALTVSGSFKVKKKSVIRPSLDADEFINLLHGSDPVKVELNRLENEVRDKDRELSEAQAEIKALKLSERQREKAVEELREELAKVEGKLKLTESLLESKNLEIKKINDEKKASLAAQFAAEATLRRVHAAQKDDDMPPIEAILAPLEAEIKLARQEIAKLQDDNKALDRLTKSKEAALIEAERTVEIALAKASLVDDLQNKNQELMKQIEICQEENKILDKMHRQKVAEVEKLSQTVHELEEAVLAGGAAANAVRDYQRKVQEMNEERKTLDRELARAKVTANRVAVVVANEWKDANDKVMPVKQWLEERRFLQGEMQQLRDKLAVVERAARSEAQLKEKYQLRLKVLVESLRVSTNGTTRSSSEGRSVSNGLPRRQSLGGADNISKLTTSGSLSKRLSSHSFHSRSSISSSNSMVLRHAKGASKSFDGGSRSLNQSKILLSNGTEASHSVDEDSERTRDSEAHNSWKDSPDGKFNEVPKGDGNEYVSVLLYDMLQKEVIALRKASLEKDESLKDKDEAIEMLGKKVDTLTKAMEVEAKKMRREVAAMEKEVAAMRLEKEQEQRAKRLSSSKGSMSSQMLLGSNQYICQYSFTYTDINQPRGYFASDVINFPQTNYPGYRTTFGCRSNSTELTGVLGLNLGMLSFVKQSNIPRFSYCIPGHKPQVRGTLIIGYNPNSASLKYTRLQSIGNKNLPYYDYDAYSLKIQGIMVGNRVLNISSSVFEPEGMGAGQTFISSSTLFTHLVMGAYREVRREFLRQNWKLVSKVSTMYAGLGGLDLCFELGSAGSNYIQGLSGVVLVFDGGVELRVEKDKLLAELEPGLWCFTFGGTDLVGLRASIIGTYHQQDLWVEYDIDGAAIGFAPADCSK
ncbi:Microtubule-associated protein 70-2 [Nymphaea thermarum]|nr:Microtubule-associated protein 70-2 [Nymphaea thermarum]